MTQFYETLTPEKTEREEKNMQLVRKGAGECMVLLENDGVLPLKKIGKIALYGAGARHTIKGGTGSGDVNSREVINVEQSEISIPSSKAASSHAFFASTAFATALSMVSPQVIQPGKSG